MQSRIILVFDPEASGHHMEYLRHLFTCLEPTIPSAKIVLLTTQSAAEHPNFQRLAADFGHLMQIRIARPIGPKTFMQRLMPAFAGRQSENAAILAQGIDDFGPENVGCVLLAHLEAIGVLNLALWPGILRGRPWLAIMIGVRYHHRQVGIAGPFRWQDFVQRWLFEKILRQAELVRIAVIDPYFVDTLNHPKVSWSPDPVIPPRLTNAQQARASYGLRPETCVILVFGFISHRKCIDALLAGVARLAPSLDVTVFLAGTQHGRLRQGLANNEIARTLRENGRLIEVDRYIMDDQDLDPMSTADICWVLYDQTWVMPSGVLLLAAVAGRAVICRRQGVIGRLVEENQCGLALTSDHPATIAAAITKLAHDPALRDRMGANGRRAFAGQTPERFAQPIIDAIIPLLSAS